MENTERLQAVQVIAEEFKMVALAALVATATIWVFVSMNLFALAATYFAFLAFISFMYLLITPSEKVESDR